MKYSHFLIALLLSVFLIAFVSAQTHIHEHSKMQKISDTSLVKESHHKMIKEKYICPMHPEVILDKPGKCPKCGMNLVKVKQSLNIENSHAVHKDTSMSHPKKTH
jgi:hypothetical protein